MRPQLIDHSGRNAAGHLVGGDVVGLDYGTHNVVGHLPEFLGLGPPEAGRFDRREVGPALLTRIFTPPNLDTVFATTRSQLAGRRRSATSGSRLVFRPRPGASGGRADDTASLFRRLHSRLRRSDARVRPRHPQPCCRIEGAGGNRDPALRPDADRPPRQPRRARAALSVAHGVWLDEDDMARLGDHGASVAHNPGSNMRLGSGLADTRTMLERRVNLGIGTDGANCADNQNMYEVMRLASFVSKVQGPDWRRWLTTREAALAATEGSVRALGFGERIGRLAPGYKADIVMLDLDHPDWLPFNDPVPVGPHRGRHCGRQRDDRRPPGGRRPPAADGRSRPAPRPRRGRARASRPPPSLRSPRTGRGTYCPGLARTPYHIDRYGARLE